jgi:uncharacterized DUF497 family protein
LVYAGAAQAESRIFIIPNDPDGYGVDRCLAIGASCGAVVAAAYCRRQQFVGARSFRKVDREETTGAILAATACREGCNEFIAIECTR